VIAARKAKAFERLVQKIAGIISGERPPCAVGTAQTRRETHDQKGCRRWSKGGYRRVKPAWLSPAPVFPELLEPRTERAVAGRRVGIRQRHGLNARIRPPRRQGRHPHGGALRNAAEIAACAGRAAHALPVPLVPPDRARSFAATPRCRETHPLAGAARRLPWAAGSL